MKLLLRGASAYSPMDGLDGETVDVLLDRGRIAEVGPRLSADGAKELDLSGLVLMPGLIDAHVHLRQPGREDEETIATGTAAAVAGGFTSVLCMPNTEPALDNQGTVSYVVEVARREGNCRVFPVGAISVGRRGERLAEMGELVSCGCVAVTDDGNPVEDSALMRSAMEYSGAFGIPVVSHCEDMHLSAGGTMREGYYSTALGLSGIPDVAETAMALRDIVLADYTGARLHICHVSTARTVDIIREAKARGVPLTSETAPHYLVLTDADVVGYDPNTRVNPPLGTDKDRAALRYAVADGTIDIIATDHAPHASTEKEVEYDQAATGMIGLETSVGLVLSELVAGGTLSLGRMAELMSAGPARTFGLDGLGRIRQGAKADLTAIDQQRTWTVEPARMRSKSRNTPFAGRRLQGAVVLTIVNGRAAHDPLGMLG